MTSHEMQLLRGFYENQLSNQILSFWLPRCEDKVYGGYFNCFDNRGMELLSHDKYTWSQGRFVWMFSKLAALNAPVFSHAQRREFLRLAGAGARFLMKHCLMETDDWRCVFLMGEDGAPKKVDGCDTLDMSIYADCFVVAGLAKYAEATGDRDAYFFAKRLYRSIVQRVKDGNFHTLPYPLSPAYRAHGIPMILSSVTKELYTAAVRMNPSYCDQLKQYLTDFTQDILTHFMDENHLIHEVIRRDGSFLPQVLGQHINPGHTLEDMWFMIDAADILAQPAMVRQAALVAKHTLKAGWDDDFGGILHFASMTGGQPTGDAAGVEDEPMTRQLSGWGDKLWWVHSEALYTTLLCYARTGDEAFLDWHRRVFDYTFKAFPGDDPEIREWIQILGRDGTPQDKVVALPVKDPYHITRNLALMLELLYHMPAALEEAANGS